MSPAQQGRRLTLADLGQLKGQLEETTTPPKPPPEEALAERKAEPGKASGSRLLAGFFATAPAEAAPVADPELVNDREAEKRARIVASYPEAEQLLAVLQERYPRAFPRPPATPVPLKIGIDRDIVAAGLAPNATALRTALVWWTKRPPYWRALRAGGNRVDLDGNPAGEVSPEHRITPLPPRVRTAQPKSKASWKAGVKPATSGEPQVIRLDIRALKVSVVLDPAAFAAAATAGPPGVLDLHLPNGQAVKATINARSIRKSLTTIGELGAENVVMILQGRLVGDVIEEAGLSAQPKKKPMAEPVAGNG